MIYFAQSTFVLALTFQAQGRTDRAKEITDSIVQYMFDTGNTSLLAISKAFQAELALRQGRIAEADYWARDYNPEPFILSFRYYDPRLTLAKTFLTRDTVSDQKKAYGLLDRLHDFFTSVHYTRSLIDVLALQAMLHNARSDETAALKKLTESLALAEPGSFIRPFLDLGPKMADLLNRMANQNLAVKYVGKLLAALRKERSAGVLPDAPENRTDATDAGYGGNVMDALSKRELEVLALLAQRLSNKEIAQKLFISPGTVKQHLNKIFQKLNVATRREAAAKSSTLGILRG